MYHDRFSARGHRTRTKGRIDATFDSKEKEASETIEIRVIFKNSEPNGMPKFEVLQYTFELVK